MLCGFCHAVFSDIPRCILHYIKYLTHSNLVLQSLLHIYIHMLHTTGKNYLPENECAPCCT